MTGFRCLLYLSAAASLLGCGRGLTGLGDDDGTLHCDEPLTPPEEATFDALYALVSEPSPLSCAGCHNRETPVAGYDFETRSGAYDALSTKTAVIYGQVAAGAMPQAFDVAVDPPARVDGEPWGEDELRLLRSWACYGALDD
jgi:hypothetical protein